MRRRESFDRRGLLSMGERASGEESKRRSPKNPKSFERPERMPRKFFETSAMERSRSPGAAV